jgi:hypothetical protein
VRSCTTKRTESSSCRETETLRAYSLKSNISPFAHQTLAHFMSSHCKDKLARCLDLSRKLGRFPRRLLWMAVSLQCLYAVGACPPAWAGHSTSVCFTDGCLSIENYASDPVTYDYEEVLVTSERSTWVSLVWCAAISLWLMLMARCQCAYGVRGESFPIFDKLQSRQELSLLAPSRDHPLKQGCFSCGSTAAR